MKERHNWATGKHPKTCTCAVCTQRRLEAALPRPQKKKRKAKSLRGQGGKVAGAGKQNADSPALADAMDILNRSHRSSDTEPASESDNEPTGGEPSDN